MNIAKKIMLGYGALLLVVFMHLIHSLSSLEEMNRINGSITKVNAPTIESAERLAENLLGQDLYARKLGILKDSASFKLLQLKITEFDQLIEQIRSFNSPLASVKELAEKGAAFRDKIAESYGSMESAFALSKEQKKEFEKRLQEVVDLSSRVAVQVRLDQNVKTDLSTNIGRRAYRGLLVVGCGSVLLAVGITLLFARYISRSVEHLKLSTRLVSESKFEEVSSLQTNDEFGEVSRSIAEMAKQIEHLEKIHITSNPLSLLPGGLAIDDNIGNRLASGLLTAVCILDLDNFKVFNDKYGYAKGNEVIQATAAIITAAVKEKGVCEDFVGHIGGDDFIVVTEPKRYEDICKTIIKRFDEQIPMHYDSADRLQGAIVGKNRQGVEVVFPLMTISIAVATDQEGSISNPQVLSRRAAELKEYAKSMSGSVYVVDHRQYKAEENT
jgi:diguanylate cyclase (GGDEF)-like protein